MNLFARLKAFLTFQSPNEVLQCYFRLRTIMLGFDRGICFLLFLGGAPCGWHDDVGGNIQESSTEYVMRTVQRKQLWRYARMSHGRVGERLNQASVQICDM